MPGSPSRESRRPQSQRVGARTDSAIVLCEDKHASSVVLGPTRSCLEGYNGDRSTTLPVGISTSVHPKEYC